MRFSIIGLTAMLSIFAIDGFAQADVALDFTGSPDNEVGSGVPVIPGGRAHYRAAVTNNGPSPALNVVVTISFPPKTLLFLTSVFGNGTCSSDTSTGSLVVTCTQATMASGEQLVIDVSIVVATDYPWPNALIVTAVVSAATADPVPSNNQRTVTLPVAQPLTVPTLGEVSRLAFLLGLAIVGLWAIRRAT